MIAVPSCSWLQQQYPIDENSARSICEIFRQQIDYLGEDAVPTNCRIVVQECIDRETGRRIYYFLSGYGLRFNEGLARMVAYLLARQRMSDICITTTDSGFVLSLPASGKVNLPAIIGSIREENCEQLLYPILAEYEPSEERLSHQCHPLFHDPEELQGTAEERPAPAI